MRNVQLLKSCFCTMLLIVATASTANGSPAKPVKELIEYFAKKFGRELAQEGVEQTTRRLDGLVARYGDEVLAVVKPIGPRGVAAAEEFGPAGVKILREGGQAGLVVLRRNGAEAVELASKYGDEAVGVIVHQPGIAADLLRAFPRNSYSAIAKLSSDEAVHLAKMAPDFAKMSPKAQTTFLEKLALGGDDFVKWVWKRKIEIFGTGAGVVALISAYKVGDGVAEGVTNMFPSPPDPEKSPGLWMSYAALLIGEPLFFIAVVIALGLYLRHRRLRSVSATRSYPYDPNSSS